MSRVTPVPDPNEHNIGDALLECSNCGARSVQDGVTGSRSHCLSCDEDSDLEYVGKHYHAYLKWACEGSSTIEETANELDQLADNLKSLESKGWRLQEEIKDGHATFIKLDEAETAAEDRGGSEEGLNTMSFGDSVDLPETQPIVRCEDCGSRNMEERDEGEYFCYNCKEIATHERAGEEYLFRAKWMCDGISGIRGMITLIENKARQLRRLDAEGWNLMGAVSNDYARLERIDTDDRVIT